MVYHGSYMTLWITPVFSNQQSTGHGKPTVLDLPAGHRPHLPHGGCHAADHQGKAGTNHFEMGASWGYSLWVYIYGIQSFIIYEYTLYLIWYIYIFIYIYMYTHLNGEMTKIFLRFCADMEEGYTQLMVISHWRHMMIHRWRRKVCPLQAANN